MVAKWIRDVGFCGALLFSTVLWAAEEPKIQSLSAYTRIQIPVSGASSFRQVNGSGEARITIDRVRAASLAALSSLSDRRVSSITVTPQGLDKAEITLRFPQADIQSFAYLQGGSLVVDLWKQDKGQDKAEIQTPAVQPAPVAAKKIASKPAKAKRKLASTGNAEEVRVKAQILPLSRERELFTRFVLPVPELTIEHKAWSLPPKLDVENQWKFAAADRNTDDGRGFWLAQKLFGEGKFGLTVKTAEITLRDNPETEHAEELRLLQAFSYKKLGETTKNESLRQRADQMLSELAAKRTEGKAPPFHRQLHSYFAQKAYARQDWLQAITHLEYVREHSSKGDGELPYVLLILADVYGKVGEPRRAERLYRFLTESVPNLAPAKEAAYRSVDLLASEKNYQRVTEEGAAAIDAFPAYEKSRPEVVFNLGEAHFWLGNYARSEKYFRRYVENYSAQTNAAMAWVRLGEIAEISRGAIAEARQHYYKAKNGYPFSRGDLVAGVRLARIDVNTEKDVDFVSKNLRETLQDKSIDGDFRRMTELVYVDYLLVSGDTEPAIQLSRRGMGESDGVAFEAYKHALVKSLFAKLRKLNKEGKHSEAIALFDKEKKWLELYGADSFRAAAESYRGLGLYATSNELMERYAREKSMGSGRALASTAAGRDLLIEKAKNSFARGAYAETLAQLPDEDDAESLYMRAISEQRLGRKRESQGWALKALNAAHSGDAEERLADEKTEELAEILIDRDMTEREFARMEKNIDQAIAMRKEPSERLELARADSLWYQKRNKEAAAAYREWITKFPKSTRLDRARYNLGMSLIGAGKREEAVKALTEVRDSGKSVWAESARQELELIEWETKYSSVLKTLPPTGLGISN